MSAQRWGIPDSWVWSSMGNVSDVVGGGTPSTEDDTNFSEHGIPWLTPADLTGYRETYISRGRRDLSEKGYKASAARKVPAGTVLFSSRAPVGYCVIAAGEISTNQGFKSFILRGGLSAEYVRHYLLASVDYAESKASGTTFKELSGSRAAELVVPIAPLAEQRRIAAKIDSLSAKSRSAREHLDHIPRLVEKYKQAILAAAFRGELTREWRQERALEGEYRRAGLGELLLDIRYGTAKKCDYGLGETPVLRIPNVQNGSVTLDDLKSANFDDEEIRKLRLERGDILFIRSNGSLDLVGRCALVNDQAAGMLFAGYLIRLRPNRSLASSEFIMLSLRAAEMRSRIEALAKSTSGVNNINSRQIQGLQIQLPSLQEQSEIVRRTELAFAWIDRLACETAQAHELIAKLDQAVLAKAFRGELVPQDPNDEPARVLLERIRAQPAAGVPTKRIKTRGREH